MSCTRGSSVPVRRITAYPAATRRRTSSAYASERTESVLDATRSATGGPASGPAAGAGTAFCTGGMLFQAGGREKSRPKYGPSTAATAALPTVAAGAGACDGDRMRDDVRLAAPHAAGRPHAPLRRRRFVERRHARGDPRYRSGRGRRPRLQG